VGVLFAKKKVSPHFFRVREGRLKSSSSRQTLLTSEAQAPRDLDENPPPRAERGDARRGQGGQKNGCGRRGLGVVVRLATVKGGDAVGSPGQFSKRRPPSSR